MEPKYKRIILKVSGEALAGDNKFGLNTQVINNISKHIKKCHDMGVEIAIVVGGGNFWRGRTGEGMDRATADYIGMLATVMNALALQDSLEQLDLQVRVQSAIEMRQISESYIRRRAIRHLEKGRVVIFAAGTGNPFFTTDTASALRASEIDAEVMLMAKNGVDGVYTDDPKVNPEAKKIEKMSYDDIIKNELKVMDTAACALCKQNKIPIIVFDFKAKGSLEKIMDGEAVGTYVS